MEGYTFDMIKIYFAGSISAGRGDLEHYLRIIELLSRHSIVSSDAADGELFAREADLEDRQIYRKEMTELRDSDVVVAEITTPSLGVGYQIAKAEQYGKPVLCLQRVAERRVSPMIGGSPRSEVTTYVDIDEIGDSVELFLTRHGFNSLPDPMAVLA